MKKVMPVLRKARPNPERQFCNYVHRVCMQTRLDGYNYCIRHILEDKTAPFRQCNFVHMQSGQRCTNAAPRSEKKDCFLCPWHSKIAHRSRNQQSKHLAPTPQTPQLLLEVLERHCSGPHPMEQSTVNDQQPNEKPGLLLDAYESCSDSGSERDSALQNFAWKREPESEPESSDSEQEDPLKHAGVYTAEEASLILRDKLVRLQSLYLGQFKRLQHVWKDKRNKYLQALKIEDPTDSNATYTKAQQHKNMLKLRALQHYHRPRGIDALLQWRLRLKRMKPTESASGDTKTRKSKCTFTNAEGELCAMSALPYCKFCKNHILKDSRQVLFQSCREEDCSRPVPPVKDTCLLHTTRMSRPKPLQVNPAVSLWSLSGPSGEGTRQADLAQEPELFQTMDDIAALGLDVVQPGSLFGLNQFGEFGE